MYHPHFIFRFFFYHIINLKYLYRPAWANILDMEYSFLSGSTLFAIFQQCLDTAADGKMDLFKLFGKNG